MSTVINTNLASLFAQNSLTNAQNNLATSVQRLSSGLRINSAKDDAAGLAISQNMQSQILGTNQSINNLSDATNLLQTADSSLSTIQDMLLKLKQLAVQGYDGSLNSTQKADIVTQMQDLNNEINATAQRTQFNGINLLTSGSSVDLNNSDIKSGAVLTNTPVAVNASSGLGLYSLAGANAATGLSDVASGLLAGTGLTGSVNDGTTATNYSITLDPQMAPKTPGTYVLSSNGSNLTLTGTFNGLAQSQTVTVADAASNNTGGSVKTTNQVLNFSNFGIQINLTSNRAAGDTEVGANIATKLATSTYNTLNITGQTGVISDVSLAGVAPGSYQLTYNETGSIGSLSMPAATSGRVTGMASAGVLYNVALTGGSTGSSGATANVSYDASGNITAVALNQGGSAYKAGDVLGIASAVAVAAPATPVTQVITQGSNGSAPVTESSVLTLTGASATTTMLIAGQSATIGGLTFTASAAVTRDQLGAAFSSVSAGATSGNSVAYGAWSGKLTGFNLGAFTAGGATFSATSSVAGTNVTDLALSSQGTAAIASGGLTGIVVGSNINPTGGTKTLTMSGSINGVATTQSVAILDNNANSTENINFSSFGAQLSVYSNQFQSATAIGTSLATLNGVGGTGVYGNPGQLIVAQGNNSNLQFQSGANSSAFININTANVQTGASGTNAGTSAAMIGVGTSLTTAGAGNLAGLSSNDTIATWQQAFQNAAAAADKAVDYISTQRATYGSQMNRLSYISSNLTAQSTNLQTSKSAITDTNFASETATLTKGQIMQQAATAMLAQANQMPNVILSLLK